MNETKLLFSLVWRVVCGPGRGSQHGLGDENREDRKPKRGAFRESGDH